MGLKIILALIAVLNGVWMIFDGIHVLMKGKYFGPAEPGPWSKIVSAIGLEPFSLGVLFIIFGLAWITSLLGLFSSTGWGWYFAVCIAIATLWYVPVGTILSIIYLILLIVFKGKFIHIKKKA